MVDSGSTNSFMNYDFAIKSGCEILEAGNRRILVAGGGMISSSTKTGQLSYTVQGHPFERVFQLIPLKGFDVILGADWIYDHSPISLDLKQRVLWVTCKGQQVKFVDHTLPQGKIMIKAGKFGKMLDKGIMGFFIEVLSKTEEKKEETIIPEQIAVLLQEFADIFAEPKGLTPKRDCDHAIPLKVGAEPPSLRPYRVPHQQKNAMEEIIKELLDSKEIRLSLSPYSSPAFMVRKKDGNWRMCVDYRQLNAKTVKNKFPMPIIEDLSDELNGAKVFTKLDLRSGYHQIRMVEGDIPKTAFKTHMGHFEYLVMPFGLTNAPATFQALMNQIFGKLLRKCVLVFFDDILIYSRDLREHEQHLRIVLNILRSHKLFAKRSKCTFAVGSIEYLGHIVSGEGVATKPSKIQDVLDWPVPKNVSKLRGFLGLTRYYRRFVKGYGTICRPLHDLLKKNSYQWGVEQQKAFDNLKEVMTSCPVLALPNFNQPFVLETDACGTRIGVVLMQEGRPIAYFSKSLGKKAASSSTYEKEAIAILEALKKWRHYFLGNQVVIRTNQQSLKFMAT